MNEIRSILCPVDLSAASRPALRLAVSLARLYRARVCALEVVHTGLPPAPFGSPRSTLEGPVRNAYVKDLETFVEQTLDAGESVPIEIRIADGRVPREILREAEDLPADLIVIGTHGRGGFDRFVLGSVAEKILRKSACPVLTVPPATRSLANPASPFASIVCAVDFSAATLPAIGAAAGLARRFHSALTVVHVFDWMFAVKDMNQMPQPIIMLGQSLERQARSDLHKAVVAARIGQPVTEMVVADRPVVGILRAARECQANLIVMGVVGRGSIDLALMGSTADHIVRASACPVLTVRTPAHQRLADVSGEPQIEEKGTLCHTAF